jgi:hypothetical protein
MLLVAVIVGAFACGSFVSAQEQRPSKPAYTSEAMLARISGGSTATTQRVDAMCALPDKSERAVNATVAVDVRTYRCVEVLDQNLQPLGAAWTSVSASGKPMYTSEAMVRRIRGGSAATTARAGAMCVLADKTERAVNATVTLDGRTSRCVEILDENLQPRGAAWTPVTP